MMNTCKEYLIEDAGSGHAGSFVVVTIVTSDHYVPKGWKHLWNSLLATGARTSTQWNMWMI